MRMIRKVVAYIFRMVLFEISRSDFVFNWFFADEKPIFCYHNVSSTPSGFEKSYSLNHTPKIFESQLKIINSLFEIGDPRSLIENTEVRKAYITFDDGFLGSLTEGLEILKKYNIKAVFFLNMATVIREEPYWVSFADEFQKQKEKEIQGHLFLELPWSEWIKDSANMDLSGHPQIINLEKLHEIDKSNQVYFGNHLYNHFNATKLSSEQLIYQFEKNKENLSQFSSSINFFAFPFGQPRVCYNRKTCEEIRKLGEPVLFTAFSLKNSILEKKFFHRYSLSPNLKTKNEIKSELIYQKVRAKILSLFDQSIF